MNFYSGIDLHSRQSTICVIDDKDKIHLRTTVSNQIQQILHPLQSFTPFPEVAVEATLNWYWLVDGLQEAGFKVKLAHPFGLQIIKKAKVKTDNRDAFNLARLLRLDALPESYIYPKAKRSIRDLLRRRQKIVSLRASDYVILQRVFQQYAIPDLASIGAKKISPKDIESQINDPAIKRRCQMELERIDLYSRQIQVCEDIIISSLVDDPDFKRIQTIPGIGNILAAIILYETGDVNRFKSVKHYCSYARVVPGIAQSSSTIRRGKGSKQSNPYLKFAFNQAAALAVRYCQPIKKFRQKHLNRKRSKARKLISISIVSHKLAKAAYYMLTRKEPFRMEMMFGSYL
jgi:transposase